MIRLLCTFLLLLSAALSLHANPEEDGQRMLQTLQSGDVRQVWSLMQELLRNRQMPGVALPVLSVQQGTKPHVEYVMAENRLLCPPLPPAGMGMDYWRAWKMQYGAKGWQIETFFKRVEEAELLARYSVLAGLVQGTARALDLRVQGLHGYVPGLQEERIQTLAAAFLRELSAYLPMQELEQRYSALLKKALEQTPQNLYLPAMTAEGEIIHQCPEPETYYSMPMDSATRCSYESYRCQFLLAALARPAGSFREQMYALLVRPRLAWESAFPVDSSWKISPLNVTAAAVPGYWNAPQLPADYTGACIAFQGSRQADPQPVQLRWHAGFQSPSAPGSAVNGLAPDLPKNLNYSTYAAVYAGRDHLYALLLGSTLDMETRRIFWVDVLRKPGMLVVKTREVTEGWDFPPQQGPFPYQLGATADGRLFAVFLPRPQAHPAQIRLQYAPVNAVTGKPGSWVTCTPDADLPGGVRVLGVQGTRILLGDPARGAVFSLENTQIHRIYPVHSQPPGTEPACTQLTHAWMNEKGQVCLRETIITVTDAAKGLTRADTRGWLLTR